MYKREQFDIQERSLYISFLSSLLSPLLPSFLPSFLPFSLPSILSSFLSSFHPSLYPSLHPSYYPSFILPSYLPYFLLSFLFSLLLLLLLLLLFLLLLHLFCVFFLQKYGLERKIFIYDSKSSLFSAEPTVHSSVRQREARHCYEGVLPSIRGNPVEMIRTQGKRSRTISESTPN